MKIKNLFIALFLLSTLTLFGNDQPSQDSKSLSVAYFGEFITHPGLVVSLEMPFHTSKGHECFATVRGGGYYHYMNHKALFIGSELGYRYTFKNGLDLHALAGVNYMHKFLDGDIYEMTDSGEVDEVTDYGSSHFMPNIACGFGYTFAQDSSHPTNLYFRAELFGEYPYNTYMLPHVAATLGLRMDI
ncbi:MAG: hypothetical protein PQJ60_14905 [Spirochaetales bacterium]|nr:hypothetical protein [Spirochaetales bacterium]